MILLTVKIAAENFKSAPVRPGEYDRAWYRLVNSETSQTIDYKKIKEVSSPDVPEEGGASAEDGGDGGDGSSAPKIFTYVAGRIFYDHSGNGRWVYE